MNHSDVSKPSPSIDAIMISYGCVYKRSSKPVMKEAELKLSKQLGRNISNY